MSPTAQSVARTLSGVAGRALGAARHAQGERKRPVLVIQHYALPRDQGGGTRAIDLFGRLSKWTPTIVASNFGHANARRYTTSDPHFVLVPVPSYTSNGIARIMGMPAFTLEAFGVGLTHRADVVFGSIPHLLNPVAALALARVKGVPFVLEVRDLWPESIVAGGKIKQDAALHRILVMLERFLYQQASRIVVVTGGWEEHFAALGIPADKLVMIPNGTEVSDFEVGESREDLRAEYGITGTTAIFAGSHGPKDGIFLILDAAEQTPEVNFLLIGDGIDKPKAIEAARNRGLDNVEFREPIAKSELPRLLRACDIGLHVVTPLTVFNKGMSPNKLFDYLASGITVVSNAPVPLRNVVRDDEVGVIVEPDQISAGVRRALSADEDTRARWRARAQELMSTTYSRSAASASLEQVLDEAAGAPASPLQRALRVADRKSVV